MKLFLVLILFSSDTAHHHHFHTEEELIERFKAGQQIMNKIRPLEENVLIKKKHKRKKKLEAIHKVEPEITYLGKLIHNNALILFLLNLL